MRLAFIRCHLLLLRLLVYVIVVVTFCKAKWRTFYMLKKLGQRQLEHLLDIRKSLAIGTVFRAVIAAGQFSDRGLCLPLKLGK